MGTLKSKEGVNHQILSRDAPTDDQGFLTLTLVSDEGAKEFVVTNTLQQLLGRTTKYVEYFSTAENGKKLGVSLEWQTRDEIWTHLSDKDLGDIRKFMQSEVSNLLQDGTHPIDLKGIFPGKQKEK